MQTPSLASLAASRLPLRTAFNQGLLDPSNPYDPRIRQTLQNRITLESLLQDNLLEEGVSWEIFKMAFRNLNYKFVWNYLEKFYPSPEPQPARRVRRGNQPNQPTQVTGFADIPHNDFMSSITSEQYSAIGELLERRKYNVSIDTALETAFFNFQEDVTALLTNPNRLFFSEDQHKFVAWDRYNNQYRLFVKAPKINVKHNHFDILPYVHLFVVNSLEEIIDTLIGNLRVGETLSFILLNPNVLEEEDRTFLSAIATTLDLVPIDEINHEVWKNQRAIMSKGTLKYVPELLSAVASRYIVAIGDFLYVWGGVEVYFFPRQSLDASLILASLTYNYNNWVWDDPDLTARSRRRRGQE